MNTIGYKADIYRKVKKYRIERGFTQKELADKSGVSARSLQRFEAGEEISLSAFINILWALGLIDNVNNAIPDMDKRPSVMLAKEKHEEKKRVRKKQPKNPDFKWGDET